MGTNENKNEISEITKWYEKTKRKDLEYKTKNYTWFFAIWKQ